MLGVVSPSSSATTARGGKRIRLDADDRRDQILEGARRLFAARPYSSVSTTELATAAGTTRTNLHYYFGTKRELYLEVLREFGQLPALPAEGAGRSTGPAELDRLFARWLDVLEENPQTIMSMIGTVAPGADPEVEAVFRDGRRAWEDRLIAVLELPDETSMRAMIRSFQGMVSTAVAEWLNTGSLTKDQVHTLLTRTLLALAPR